MFERLTSIIHKADYATSPKAQVQAIVDDICESVQLDVCTLYRLDDSGNLDLLASHGLDTSSPISIPAGQGLVGRVIREGHSINLIYPANERDYFYLPKSNEDAFLSFFGSPVIYQGKPLGVLVVQGKNPVRLSTEHEGFLIALCAHLSGLLANLPLGLQPLGRSERHFSGVSGAPGIALGQALLLSNDLLSKQTEDRVDNADAEIVQWQSLKTNLFQDFEQEKKTLEKSLGASMANIMEAYQLFLQDPALTELILQKLAQGFALPWAIKQSIETLAAPFLEIEDAYLKARSEDIFHLGNRLLAKLHGQHDTPKELPAFEQMVLVGDNISVSDIVNLPSENILGIVSYTGAALSHVAVLANALGVPAVLGIGDIGVTQGDCLIVDGDNADVVLQPGKALVSEYKKLIKDQRETQKRLQSLVNGPAKTKDGVEIQLLANSGLQADLRPGLANGAGGIGLYRTEIPFMIHNGLPSEEEQVQVYKQVVDAYNGKPVYIRTLDVGSDKPLPYLPQIQELNPALGLRGIRFALDNYQLQLTQMRAILRAANGRPEVHITIPMVSTTEDLDRVRELLDEALRQLISEGYVVRRPKLGIMVEVPAAVTLLPFWADKIDFISIGSNDLSQYLLAVDRTSAIVSQYYNVLNPAVIHEIYRITNMAKQLNLPVSLCGEMATNAIAVMLLLGMGISRLSMSSAKIPLMNWVISHCKLDQLETFLMQSLELDSAEKIASLGEELIAKMGIDFEKLH